MKWVRTKMGPSSSKPSGAWQPAHAARLSLACSTLDSSPPLLWHVLHGPVVSGAWVAWAEPTWI